MSKKTTVAKINAEEERKCGTRWKYVVPWHADADEPADWDEPINSFAATHSNIVAAPGTSFGQVCPCSAPSDMCDSCCRNDEEGDMESLLEGLVFATKENADLCLQVEEAACSRREAKLDARLSAPTFRGCRVGEILRLSGRGGF